MKRIAALFFARFWRNTRDRFFLAFAAAFLLRVPAYVIILAAIVDKNLSRRD